MGRGWIGGAVGVALALAGTAAAQDASSLPSQERYHLRLQYRWYHPSLTGDAQKGSAASAGSVVDVNDDLGFTDQSTWDGRGTFKLSAGWKIRGAYMPVQYDGDTEAGNTFDYGDIHTVRFDHVVSSVKGAYYSADLEWDFIKGSHGFLGALAGGRVIDLDSSVVNVTTNQREVDTVTAPIPVVGLATRIYASRLSIEGELAGMSMGSRGDVFEAETSVRLHVSDHLAVMGGYRHVSMDGKKDLHEVNLKLSGWQFGVELSL
jgi:hypothetical protein